MKIKKFFSGILAAIMSIAVIAVPVSTASADTNEKCTIIINHAATSGTYTAYPIFTGEVEQEEDENGTTGRLVIDSPKFHPNLKTKIVSNKVADGSDIVDNSNTIKYGLFEYINGSSKINEKTFAELMKAYDPNTSLTNLTIAINGTSNPAANTHAELIANTLNLTNDSNAVNNILADGKATSAFYSAFAEAARLCMIDNVEGKTITDLTGTATGLQVAGSSPNRVEIVVDAPGYYLVEWTPGGDYEESVPRAVRRSLVLVGKGENCKATINSKDTENIATVDIQFNDNMLVQNDDGTFSYAGGSEGNWAKNVSAGNGDYVNCRVVVTLPSNLSAYDQYYLAVPIMYGYNVTSTLDFDKNKSITRIKDTAETDPDPLKYIKVYFLNKNGTTKAQIIKNPNIAGNFTESASEIFGDDKGHNATLEVKDSTYTYANSATATDIKDDFKAAETFVISDIANMLVRDTSNGNGAESQTLKWRHDNDSPADSWDKFVIEFPVKFDRFSGNILNEGASNGVNVTGYGFAGNTGWVYGDDALMKNYITAKAVYSNNPNLKALKTGETAYDKTATPDGVKLYLDTSKDPGTLQNPVAITKESSTNIVTYRLRVHATTNDLVKLNQNGGVEGVRFALMDNKTGKYARVKLLGNPNIYDTVDGELIRETNPKNPNASSNQGAANVYKITGWIDKPDSIDLTSLDYILRTYNQNNSSPDGKGQFANNNSGRFEILGLAPGGYTLVALDENIKTADTYATPINDAIHNKDYKLNKEDGKSKTEYKFSFAPTLVDTCTKLPYLTHYAPVGSDATTTPSGSEVIGEDNVLITDFNMHWWKGATEITDVAQKPDWWLGQNKDVGLMSMRVTYIKKGLTLPVTGGIGTFIFFAVGGAMVIISTVAIVTKFRVKRERL